MDGFSPCFIVGCERSGTTLLAVLLDRHSQLTITPETHFLKIIPRRKSHQPPSHDQLLKELFAIRQIADLQLDPVRLRDDFAKFPPTYPTLFQAILEQYAATQCKPLVGEKTPLHLLSVPLLLQWFPDARIVGIVRDGRDVVLSLRKMPWATERRLRPLCWHWVRLARLASRLRQRFPDRFFLIRHEDLLRTPEQTLQQVDEFLGLQFESQQLDTTIATHVFDPAAESWKIDAAEKIDPTRIGAWKHKLDPHERLVMNTLMGPDLRKIGYDDTTPPSCSPAARFANALINLSFRTGLFQLWRKLIEKHLPSERQKRRLARQAPLSSPSEPALARHMV